MTDGIINLGTKRGDFLGFTAERFSGYLWKLGDAIIISFIVSHQRGNFRSLVARIHDLGLTVKVPTPLGRMDAMVRRNGYTRTFEPFSKELPELCEIWSLPPPKKSIAIRGAKE